MREPTYMSKDGIVKLEKELKRLKFEKRPEIVAEIKRTRELGDLSENAEYHAAKEAQGHLERKIADLEDSLSRAHPIDKDKIPTDKVYLFAKVLLKHVADGDTIEYTIVPPEEADIDEDMISIKSPIAAALLGKSEGDTVEIKIPAGSVTYEILKIGR